MLCCTTADGEPGDRAASMMLHNEQRAEHVAKRSATVGGSAETLSPERRGRPHHEKKFCGAESRFWRHLG